MDKEPTTFERARKAIADEMGIEEYLITERTHIFEELCVRELADWYEIQVICEHEFKIGNIEDEELDRETATVKQLVELIDQKLAARIVATTG